MNIVDFPIELHNEIISYLKINDISNVVLVCKLWNNVVNDSTCIWKKLYSNIIVHERMPYKNIYIPYPVFEERTALQLDENWKNTVKRIYSIKQIINTSTICLNNYSTDILDTIIGNLYFIVDYLHDIRHILKINSISFEGKPYCEPDTTHFWKFTIIIIFTTLNNRRVQVCIKEKGLVWNKFIGFNEGKSTVNFI